MYNSSDACTWQVLLALQRLLVALGPEASTAYDFLLPALRYACDPNGPEVSL